MEISQVVIAVMAGGRSRRMGFDKLAEEIHGRTLLAKTLDIARSTGLRVLVVGRKNEAHGDGVVYLDDEEPGAGPLGGIRTALHYAAPSPVLALAADLPYLSEKALSWLIGQAAEEVGRDGLAVRCRGFLEPLFSIYTQEAEPLAAGLLADGKRSVRGLIETGEFRAVEAPDWVEAALFNANEPADWQAVVQSPPAE